MRTKGMYQWQNRNESENQDLFTKKMATFIASFRAFCFFKLPGKRHAKYENMKISIICASYAEIFETQSHLGPVTLHDAVTLHTGMWKGQEIRLWESW